MSQLTAFPFPCMRENAIGTVNISSSRAALQWRRRKCGSLTGRVGYRYLCTTSATLWLLPKPLNSLRPSDAYICVGNLTIIGSDNGLSPGQRQAITWTDVGILLIGPLGTNFSGMLINSYISIQENPFENGVWKMAAILSRYQFVKSAFVQERVALWSRDAYMCQHICVSSKFGGGWRVGIDSNNGLSARCQAIIWTNDGLILTEPLGTYLSD